MGMIRLMWGTERLQMKRVELGAEVREGSGWWTGLEMWLGAEESFAKAMEGIL